MFLDSIRQSSETEKLLLNCQLYVSAVLRALGRYIPNYYRSSEFFEDPERCLQDVFFPYEAVENGDIIGFSKVGIRNLKKLHMGIVRIADKNATEILHAS